MNLPPGSDRPTPEQPRRLDIRGLTLNGLDVQYTDAARNWGVKIPRIESELREHHARREGRTSRCAASLSSASAIAS